MHRIRTATPEDLALLPALEEAADTVFASSGIGPLPAADAAEYGSALHLLVAGDPPVGLARLEEVDGAGHLDQLSVHPSAMRRGVGSALVRAGCAWAAAAGYRALTLCTFADIPWNAPFYARLGFTPLAEDALTPGLRALRRREAELGLDALGRRTVMRRPLPTAPPTTPLTAPR